MASMIPASNGATPTSKAAPPTTSRKRMAAAHKAIFMGGHLLRSLILLRRLLRGELPRDCLSAAVAEGRSFGELGTAVGTELGYLALILSLLLLLGSLIETWLSLARNRPFLSDERTSRSATRQPGCHRRCRT